MEVARRPVIVSIIVILYVLAAAGFCIYIGLYLAGIDVGNWPFPFPPLVLLAASLWLGLTGVGAWNRKRIAWVSAIVLHVIVLVVMSTLVVLHELDVASLGPDFTLPPFFAKAAIHVAILAAWFLPGVRLWYMHSAESS